MKIRIEDIPENGLQVSFSGAQDILSSALEDIPTPDSVEIDPRISGDLEIAKRGKGVAVTGSLKASMKLQCARCLAMFPVESALRVNLVVNTSDADAAVNHDAEELDEDTVVIEGATINLGEIIVQELLLDIPMKALCRQDCPGLCPQCGELKGSAACSCPDQTRIDPRWEALARFKKEPPSTS